MFRIRPHTTNTSRQGLLHQQMVEISTSGENIPLRSEDWCERWCTLSQGFESGFKKIYEFEVRDSDVFVVTTPKSGTTWMQEAAWLLMNNLDYEQARSENLTARSQFLDLSAVHKHIPVNSVEQAALLKSPRLLKTHLPAQLLPQQIWQKKSKLIYVARNPKDVVTSCYPFHHAIGNWLGSNITEFIDDFTSDNIIFTPYWPHVLDFWQMRHEEHIFFTTYEEMQRDLCGVLVRLCEFLEVPPLKALELEKLLQHLSFQKMRDNQRANPTEAIKRNIGPTVSPEFQFMRRGKSGSFRDELSVEQQEKMNQWTRDYLEKYNIGEHDIFGDF